MNLTLITYLFAIIGISCTISALVWVLVVAYENIKTYFKDFKKIRSTKHFKEIQIKE